MSNLRLREIWIYPVKAMGGIRVPSSPVLEKGLCNDRRWMLVDENNLCMTQREYPKLALFKLTTSQPGFTITFDGTTIDLPLNPRPAGRLLNARIWDDYVDVVEESPQKSRWISQRIGATCSLVSFPEGNVRAVDPRYSLRNENVSLADAYPYMIIGEASLSDLNGRLRQPLPMNRFRPNLVFSGGAPYEEESWRNFAIGKNRFAGVKPCARCAVTTVDQETAEKGIEPLAALARYRRQEAKVLFGQNVIAIDHEEIFEGDEIVLG